MDIALYQDVFEPTPQTSLDQYREALMEKEELWIEAYRPRYNQLSPQRSPQGRLYPQGPTSPRPQNPQYGRLSPSQQYPMRPLYGNQGQFTDQYGSPRSSTPCPIHAALG